MNDFITLTCPNCGGQLQITEDIERFACAHCGTEHVVNRAGGIVSLKPVMDELKEVQRGTDRTASELAINRIANEIEMIEEELGYLRAEKTRIENDPKYKTNFLILTAVPALGLGALFFLGSENSSGLYCGGTLLTVGVLMIINYLIAGNLKKRREEAIEQILVLIRPKVKELEKAGGELEYHKKIVSISGDNSYEVKNDLF